MRDVGADADHVEVEAAERVDVVGDARIRLAGDADHDAAPRLIAELAKLREDAEAVGDAPRQVRVDEPVELLVGGLEAQEVAVGAGLTPGGEVLVRPLAEAERDGEPGLRLDTAHDAGDPLGLEAVVLARLDDHGAPVPRLGVVGAGEHLVLAHAVALDLAVAGRRPQ